MWDTLGFSQSPYDARPLGPVSEDEELLVNRQEESIEICTTLDSLQEGFVVLSGPPGVGKTSFFNVQQFRLATEKAEFGPKLLPNYRLCSIYPGDAPKTIALRALENLVRSVQQNCTQEGVSLPSGTAKISKWLNSKGNSGFDIGLDILGFGGSFGRSVELPGVESISFEGLQDAIECVVSEVVGKLKFDGAFLALDNIENLENLELKRLLITFRDTLFSISRVWWVLIGQSGLGSLIQSLDKRVSDRLTGTGLELLPLSFDELESAIGLRVKKFSKSSDALSPLPTNIHKLLYDASHGEIRFVFKYSHEICTKFVESIRKAVMTSFEGGKDEKSQLYIQMADRIAKALINRQIPAKRAESLLKDIVKQEFDRLDLQPETKKMLGKLAKKGEARSRDFEEFDCSSRQQFFNKYLKKLHSQGLLSKRQQGSAVFYQLRGLGAIAFKLKLVDSN